MLPWAKKAAPNTAETMLNNNIFHPEKTLLNKEIKCILIIITMAQIVFNFFQVFQILKPYQFDTDYS